MRPRLFLDMTFGWEMYDEAKAATRLFTPETYWRVGADMDFYYAAMMGGEL